ncbi:hypothetical protein Tco_0689834 [Tanacetum coccineum]
MSDHNIFRPRTTTQEMSDKKMSLQASVPRRTKAFRLDNSDPVPPRQNLLPSAEKQFEHTQGLTSSVRRLKEQGTSRQTILARMIYKAKYADPRAGCLELEKHSGGIQLPCDTLVTGCQRNKTALQCLSKAGVLELSCKLCTRNVDEDITSRLWLQLTTNYRCICDSPVA